MNEVSTDSTEFSGPVCTISHALFFLIVNTIVLFNVRCLHTYHHSTDLSIVNNSVINVLLGKT